jgi:hypothetical protein
LLQKLKAKYRTSKNENGAVTRHLVPLGPLQRTLFFCLKQNVSLVLIACQSL